MCMYMYILCGAGRPETVALDMQGMFGFVIYKMFICSNSVVSAVHLMNKPHNLTQALVYKLEHSNLSLSLLLSLSLSLSLSPSLIVTHACIVAHSQ